MECVIGRGGGVGWWGGERRGAEACKSSAARHLRRVSGSSTHCSRRSTTLNTRQPPSPDTPMPPALALAAASCLKCCASVMRCGLEPLPLITDVQQAMYVGAVKCVCVCVGGGGSCLGHVSRAGASKSSAARHVRGRSVGGQQPSTHNTLSSSLKTPMASALAFAAASCLERFAPVMKCGSLPLSQTHSRPCMLVQSNV